jgi:cystathionine beta-synthase
VVVVLLPDSGFRYLSKTYNDTWMHDHGFLESRSALTVEQVVATRRKAVPVVSVEAGATLAEAIDRMMAHGISQLPVLEAGEAVGSLTEKDILAHLIRHPEARDQAVRTVMGAPFPVVPRTLPLEQLSDYLEQGTGAVLVEAEDHTFQIITRTDLIGALASSRRNGIH